MHNHRRLALLAGCVTAACSAAVAGVGAEASTPFRACLDSENAPFSSRADPDGGIDVDVAAALAQYMGRTLKLVWVDVPNRGGLSKAMRLSVAAGACDAYFSVPLGPDLASTLHELKLTSSRSYMSVGYVYVAAPGHVAPSPEAVRQAKRIGVVTATPADLYLHEHQLPRYPYANNEALLAAVRSQQVALALVWAPALALSADQWPTGAATFVAAGQALRADLGLAVPASRADSQEQLNKAVEALETQGTLARIARKHHLVVALPP